MKRLAMTKTAMLTALFGAVANAVDAAEPLRGVEVSIEAGPFGHVDHGGKGVTDARGVFACCELSTGEYVVELLSRKGDFDVNDGVIAVVSIGPISSDAQSFAFHKPTLFRPVRPGTWRASFELVQSLEGPAQVSIRLINGGAPPVGE